VDSMAALVFTNIRISSRKISKLTGSMIGGVPVPIGAAGLACAGIVRVSMAVLKNEPVVVYFSPTYRAISSVVRLYMTPPLLLVTSYMKPLRSSYLPTNFFPCGHEWALQLLLCIAVCRTVGGLDCVVHGMVSVRRRCWVSFRR
jgi:hypothetical protein